MSWLEKFEPWWNGNPEQCSDCKIAQECLYYDYNIECKVNAIYSKKKDMTYCQCPNCDGENCRSCGHEVNWNKLK